jgi:hypothetical protein
MKQDTHCKPATVDDRGVGNFMIQLRPDQVLDTAGLLCVHQKMCRSTVIIYGQTLQFLKSVTV